MQLVVAKWNLDVAALQEIFQIAELLIHRRDGMKEDHFRAW